LDNLDNQVFKVNVVTLDAKVTWVLKVSRATEAVQDKQEVRAVEV